jgi:hypothetical protein
VLSNKPRNSDRLQALLDQLLEPRIANRRWAATHLKLCQQARQTAALVQLNSLRYVVQPREAHAPTLEVIECSFSNRWAAEVVEVAHRSGCTCGSDAIDLDNVATRIARQGLRNLNVLEQHSPPRWLGHGDALINLESVELMQARGRRSTRDARSASGQRRNEQPLLPRGRSANDDQDIGDRLGKDSALFEASDWSSVQIELGSLASGEGTVVSGCKLADGA